MSRNTSSSNFSRYRISPAPQPRPSLSSVELEIHSASNFVIHRPLSIEIQLSSNFACLSSLHWAAGTSLSSIEFQSSLNAVWRPSPSLSSIENEIQSLSNFPCLSFIGLSHTHRNPVTIGFQVCVGCPNYHPSKSSRHLIRVCGPAQVYPPSTHISFSDSDKGKYSAQGIAFARRVLVKMHKHTQKHVCTQ